jgi:nucleoside-diphosphate-sugar epimerase
VSIANIYVDAANIRRYVLDVGNANIGGWNMDSQKKAGLQVVFGTGPVGSSAARFLLEKGLDVRMVSRSGRRPVGLFDGLSADEERRLEFRAADALDTRAVLDAASGASHIYHCLNVLYQDWGKVLPTLHQNLLAAARQEHAVLAVADNLYMYARGVSVIDENTPEIPPTRKGQLRKDLHDRLLEAGKSEGLAWTTVRASDYYGPGGVLQSIFGTQFFLDPLYNGKLPRVVGSLDQPHSYTYVEDYGRALAVAALAPSAHGRVWIVPNDRTLTARQAAVKFFTAAGRDARLGRFPRSLIAAAGVFNPLLREVTEMLYQKEEPYVVDGSRFAAQFAFAPTPIEEGVRKTLAWYEATHQVGNKAAA